MFYSRLAVFFDPGGSLLCSIIKTHGHFEFFFFSSIEYLALRLRNAGRLFILGRVAFYAAAKQDWQASEALCSRPVCSFIRPSARLLQNL